MRLTFLGHAAFLIEADGQRIITDPFSSKIGYLPINESADIVTLSHQNPVYHSCLDELLGDFEVVDGLQILKSGAQIGDINFGAVEVFERSPDEGLNAMIWIEAEGLRVLHMGDCGPLPSDETIPKCGQVDVLLALTGGTPTITHSDLLTFIEKLQPRIVVPMHFGVPNLTMRAQPVEAFVEAWTGPVIQEAGSEFELTDVTLPDECELRVLVPARLKSES